ncbi:hypothetical protein DENSPDRAFT_845305 [Dentipellis sp. KUC8613]|nr:hypothetical protein DENSPDRAFT_845305 [Dentipellis sp. KUC8613]
MSMPENLIPIGPLSWSLPDGSSLLTGSPYTTSQSHGIIALIAASGVSTLAVLGLLVAISISAFNTRTSKSPNLFVRSHVVGYFISLLICDLLQAIGSFLSLKWVMDMTVNYGTLCTVQAIIKHTADVGIALWTSVIAFHTFGILFFNLPLKKYAMWCTLVGVWSATAAIVIAGPATLNTQKHGPFYGIAGEWCWITGNYNTQRVVLDYMIMFIAALFSFILYTLVFLRLRGIILVDGWRISFRFKRRAPSWSGSEKGRQDQYMSTLGKQMLLYPVAYTIIILPITVVRFTNWFGHDNVPFVATIVCDTIYLLSGLVNTILFSSTRRILPPRSTIPSFMISKPHLIESTAITDADIDPYYGGSRASIQKPPLDLEDPFTAIDLGEKNYNEQMEAQMNRMQEELSASMRGQTDARLEQDRHRDRSHERDPAQRQLWRLSEVSWAGDAPDVLAFAHEGAPPQIYSPGGRDRDRGGDSDTESQDDARTEGQFRIVDDYADARRMSAGEPVILSMPPVPALQPRGRDTVRQTTSSFLDYYQGR